MKRIEIRKARRSDSKQFVGLLHGLANFEHLEPPSAAGRKRLTDDVFRRKRINLFVAEEEGRLVGYALYFFTYSSFLAKPTFYLEDLFVLQEYRKRGIGFALFRSCIGEARAKRCGRMEWAVLTWNQKALEFYERLGARRMSDWYVYRLEGKALEKAQKTRS